MEQNPVGGPGRRGQGCQPPRSQGPKPPGKVPWGKGLGILVKSVREQRPSLHALIHTLQEGRNVLDPPPGLGHL